MRKRSMAIGVLAAIGLFAGSALGVPTQVLLNPGLEEGDIPLPDEHGVPYFWEITDVWCGHSLWDPPYDPGWTVLKHKDVYQHGSYSDGSFVFSPRGIPDPDTCRRWVFCREHSCPEVGMIEQTVAAADLPGGPGDHQLALSFYTKMVDNGGQPSYTIGKLIVDGELVAVGSLYADAVHAGDVVNMSDYIQVLATWKGLVTTAVQVNIIVAAEGTDMDYSGDPGDPGEAVGGNCLDDIELFVSNCSGQPEVAYISPSSIAEGAGPTPMTITGSGLLNVASVRMQAVRNGTQITGTIDTQSDETLTVTMYTSAAPDGVYDVILEPPGGSDCNPCVVTNGFEIVATAATTELLLTRSFEVSANTTNGQNWVGSYLKDPSAEPSPNHVPGESADKWGTWCNSRGEPSPPGEPETTDFWQTVPVADGATVTFHGWMVCKIITGEPPDPLTTSSASLTLHEGGPDGAELDRVDIDHTTPGAGEDYGDWVEISIPNVVTGNSGYVTVRHRAEISAAEWGPGEVASAWADGFSLTVSQCPSPLRPAAASPSSILFNDDVRMVVTGGSNLDEATAAKLLCPLASLPIIEGSIVGGMTTGTELVVDFPTEGAEGGVYNLVIEKESCRTPMLDFAPRHYQNRSPTFDYWPEEGTPPTFIDKLEVLSSLLYNGDFEAEGQKNRDEQPVAGWLVAPGTVPQPSYDSSLYPPSPDEEPRGYNSTNNRGGVAHTAGVNGARATIYQTVWVSPGRKISLSGVLAGRSAGGDHKHYVRLRDGGLDGAILDSIEITGDASFTWHEFTLEPAGLPTEPQVTVVWGFEPYPGGVAGVVATHVDELVLLQAPLGCNSPRADADGDKDIDQDDFAIFQVCYAGHGVDPPAEPEYCGCFDYLGDRDVDDSDLVQFEKCATGPDIELDPENPATWPTGCEEF